MNRMDWESGGAEPPTQDEQVIPAVPSDGSPALARKLTDVQPSATQDLKFVNLSHPDDVRRQKEVRTEIRRHVMKDIGQRRRRPRLKETAPQVNRTTFELGNYEISRLRAAKINSISPRRSLAMLGNFPIEADMRVLELMHFGKSFNLSL